MTLKKNPEKIFDLRTLQYSLVKGQVTQKDYDQYLNSLPDESGNFEEIKLQEEGPEENSSSVSEASDSGLDEENEEDDLL